jgi:hypothetical protein
MHSWPVSASVRAVARVRIVALVLLVATSVAACQTAGSATSGPIATVFPFDTGRAELPPDPPPSVDVLPPTVEPAATEAPFPSSHDQPDLESLLAINVAGITLATSSKAGTEAVQGGGYLPALLAALDRSEQDLATGYASDAAGNLELVVFAAKVRGASATDILSAFLNIADLQDAEQVDIGGKQVRRLVADWTSYFYAVNDMLVIVQARDPAHGEEALRQLP